MPETIIARFSPSAVWIRAAITLVVLVTAWWLVLLLPHAPAAPYGLGHRAMIGLELICTVFVVWKMASLVWQMFRYGGRAVWIENGQLRFIDTLGLGVLKSLTPADIQNLSIKSFLLYSPQIVIRMKLGWFIYIWTGVLSSPAETVCARLMDALSLPKAS